MIRSFKPYFQLQALKSIFTMVVLSWAITASILLVRNKPQTILIGIDENGVRVIRDDRDRLVAQEKLNFLKRYLHYSYNYDAKDFEEKITLAGNLMSAKLWEEKSPEFRRIKEGFSADATLIQEATIEDIRLVDDYNFQSDIAVKVTKKLQITPVKLHVVLKIGPHARTTDNPFSWEVISYEESIRQN